MRCLVLGGAGFLGSHIADALGAAVFDKARGDDFETLGADALRGVDVVYHCIGTTLPQTSNENPVHDITSNLVATLRFLDAAAAARVKKVVFLSSGGTVYGIPKTVPIPEDHPTDPICSYGIQKLAIEKYLALYQRLHGLDYAILRAANPFGRRQRPEGAQGAVTVFLHRAVRGEPVEIWGDGTVVRDYLHVSDLVRAAVRLASPAPSRIYNIGSGRGRSLLEVVRAIEAVLGRKVEVVFRPGRPFDVPSNVLDISRATREIGWAPEVPFEEGLRRTLP